MFVPKYKYYNDLISDYNSTKKEEVFNILKKTEKLEKLSLKEIAILINNIKKYRENYIRAAKNITNKIYGRRVVIFIPIYYSNFCRNRCTYCGFSSELNVLRKRLNKEEFKKELLIVKNKGFTGIELVSGEDPYFNSKNVGEYITLAKEIGFHTIAANIGVFDNINDYYIFKKAGLDMFVLFQETYDSKLYNKYHPKDTHKGKFNLRLKAYDLAASAGIRVLGLGVLFGLSNWKYDLLSMVAHAHYLKEKYNRIINFSVPRLQPIENRKNSKEDYFPVNDVDFIDIITLLRLSFPYAGITISTRENRNIRKKAFEISGTSTSAESSTIVGGYSLRKGSSQFVNHNISLTNTIKDIISIGKIPSFCTACSDINITNKKWYYLAKKGKLRYGCLFNASLTLNQFFAQDRRHITYDFINNQIILDDHHQILKE